MESNIEPILSTLFSALEKFDPTNYIRPQDEDSMTGTDQLVGSAPAVNVQAGVDVPVGAGGVDKANVIEGESPPSVTSPLPAITTGGDEELSLRSCAICLEDVPAADFLVVGPCSHGFCRSCLTAQAQHASRSSSVPVRCAACSGALDGAGLLSLLSPDDAAKLDTALALHIAGAVRHCVACGEAVAGQDGVGEFMCPRCGHINPIAGGGSHEDALQVLAQQRGWIPCPGCGNLASKADSWSCNFTTCVCGVSFCLRCGARYNPAPNSNSTSGAGPSSAGASSSAAPRPPSSNQHGHPTCQCGLYERDAM